MSYERISYLPVTNNFDTPHYIVERDGVFERGVKNEDGYWFKFTVIGRGPFPFDMLRYDHCYPGDTTSALRMGQTGETREERKAGREVTLIARSERPTWLPTFGRWRSFGWVVKSDAS